MNKGGGSAVGSGLTAAMAAAAALKHKALMQKVEAEIANIVDNFTQLGRSAMVCEEKQIPENHWPVRNTQKRLSQWRCARPEWFKQPILCLNCYQNRSKPQYFQDFRLLMTHIEQRTAEFNKQVENTDRMLQDWRGCHCKPQELESHYYSSVQKTPQSL